MLDMIDRPIEPGDYVVSYNQIYEVLDVQDRAAKMKLINPSKTTRPVFRAAREICKLDRGELLIYLLRKNT